MNQTDRRKTGPDVESPAYYVEEVYESPFKSIFLAVWRYRVIFLVMSGLITILCLALTSLMYLGRVKENMTELEFRLNFEGINNNQYPNGLKFSPSDITAPIILNKVYMKNHLDQYMDFGQFKDALAIFQRNDRMILLEKEYFRKLDEKELKSPGRKRIEDEFLAKKRNLFIPIYQLGFTSFPGMKTVPFKLKAKLLKNILESWAEFAVKKKGVDRYQISLISINILKPEEIEAEDYFISNDILRLIIRRIQDDVKKVEKLPGANLVKAGQNRFSLQDIRYRLQDLQQFKLSPLVGLIRQSGATKNRQLTLSYLENQIFNMNLNKGESVASKFVYEKSFDQYVKKSVDIPVDLSRESITSPQAELGMSRNVPNMIPQVGESFLTNLMNMVQEGSDIRYRQGITDKIIKTGLNEVGIDSDLKYYQEIYEIMKNPKGRLPLEFINTALELIKEGHKISYKEIVKAINDLNVIFLEICKINLDPGSQVYTITEPVSFNVVSSLNVKKLLLYAIFSWIILEVLIIFGIYLKSLISDKGVSTSR